jgi:hypothetical protein
VREGKSKADAPRQSHRDDKRVCANGSNPRHDKCLNFQRIAGQCPPQKDSRDYHGFFQPNQSLRSHAGHRWLGNERTQERDKLSHASGRGTNRPLSFATTSPKSLINGGNKGHPLVSHLQTYESLGVRFNALWGDLVGGK